MYLDICMHEIFVLANVHQFCEEIEQSSRSGTVDDLKRLKGYHGLILTLYPCGIKIPVKNYVSLRAFLTIKIMCH